VKEGFDNIEEKSSKKEEENGSVHLMVDARTSH
jgi:hypothetical protein